MKARRRWTGRWVGTGAAGQPWLTNAALILLGCGLLLLTRQLVSEYDHFTIGFSAVAGWSATLYVLAVILIMTRPVNRYTFGIVLVFAIGCRLVTLIPEPYLSSDIYRYAWDGIVQHAHISPYRYVPGDPALAFLRSSHQDVFDNINRREYAHTIYPPGAQFLFYLITFLNPTVIFMKLVMILFEGVTMYALVSLLRELGVRRERSLVYAWCPLLIWEIGSSGHIDSVVMAFVALALLARYRSQPVLTGIFLGLAVMTKLYPIVLLPGLFRRRDYRMPVAAAAVIACGYACYAGVGWRVFGFLNGYVEEEGIGSGTRYYLLELAQRATGLRILTATAYLILAAFVFAMLVLWCRRTCWRPEGTAREGLQTRIFGLPAEADFLLPTFMLAMVLMLLFSPHYPWYVAWLVVFLTLMPGVTALTYICGLFYLCTTALAVGTGPKQFQLNNYLYGAVLAALVCDLALHRWSVYRPCFRLERQGRS